MGVIKKIKNKRKKNISDIKKNQKIKNYKKDSKNNLQSKKKKKQNGGPNNTWII